MERYDYRIFIPGGNKTALVLCIDGELKKFEEDENLRKSIQNKVIANYKEVKGKDEDEIEQVGFINEDASSPQLIMTGGEFCGNATRSAVAYYLTNCMDKKDKEIEISVALQKSEQKPLEWQPPLQAGYSDGEIWTQMPVFEYISSAVTYIKEGGFYWVRMEGISHLIVPQTQFGLYFNEIFSNHLSSPETIAIGLLRKIAKANSLHLGNAYGIIFLENVLDVIKMHPFVYVKKADTIYYETACGSGAMCVGLLSYYLSKNEKLALLQPSGEFINTKVVCSDDGKIKTREISGKVKVIEEKYNANDLQYEQVVDKNTLTVYFNNNQLYELYDTCFGGEPYYENIKFDEVKNMFMDFLDYGILFLCFDGSKTIGFAAAMPLIHKKDVYDIVYEHFADADKYWYHAEIGSHLDYRRMGIATTLWNKEIEKIPVSCIVMRTGENNEKSKQFHFKCGFKLLNCSNGSPVIQNVFGLRKSGSIESDKRIFMTYVKK